MVRLDWWRATPADADALVGAWADPEIGRWTSVPDDTSTEAAAAWIAGEPERRARRIAVDLVIRGADDRAIGEVGLAPIDVGRGVGEAGWWLAAPSRGRGIAAGAIRALVTLGLTPADEAPPPTDVALPADATGVGLRTVFIRIHPANVASAKVAERAGFTPKGTLDDGRTLWAAP